MAISRRELLGTIGAVAAVSASMDSLTRSVEAAQMIGPLPPAGSRGPILLNKNENSYGPSEKVLPAIQRSLTLANRFPDSACNSVKGRIASYHKIKPEQVIVGVGSTEVLRSAANAYLGSGKTLIVSTPAYDEISEYAAAAGATVVKVPLDKRFANDLDGILGKVDASTGLIYISNPNNPTAILNPRSDLETFIGKLPANVHLVLDEAYHQYAGNSSSYASFIDHPVGNERVIVLRTFSKIHGLAGLRIGYGISTSQTARQIASFSVGDNISVVAAEAAAASLDDTQNIKVNVQRNADSRQEFLNQAYARMMRPVDSHTNFVFFKTSRMADELIAHFKKNNILIGPQYPGFDNYIRVSIGVPSEMKEFWRVWDLMPIINKMSM